MMDQLLQILLLPFLVGAIFTVTAAITYFFPPKNINYLYGYRTESSMKNQERWDFAQRLSSVKMFRLGLMLVAVSMAGLLFPMDETTNIIVGIALLIAGVVWLFWSTERAIKNKFPID